MREIKFRAWDKTGKQMIAHLENIQFDFEGRPVCVKSQYDLEVKNGQNSGVYERLAFEIELMQYTGLKDKNGVEIFEGDILQHDFSPGRTEKIICETDNIIALINKLRNYRNIYDLNDRFEVIGNIYEDTNLLPEKGKE